ncbi:MAG TPA: DUF3883 domain-containing protein [Pyrinomonadaceae bacterium]|jgi:hypothetical protein|nr:DUF3883 domain-containing protein [Pyrinomonadaceae bacterium]
MSNNFLQYWEPKQADDELSIDEPLNRSGSGQFKRMGVQQGDTVWIVTVRSPGELVVVGRINVGKLITKAEAIRRFTNVWDAPHHIVAESGTEEDLRELSLMDIAADLRFQSSSNRDRLNLEEGRVKAQQLQAMRKLTPTSVKLLELKWYQSELPNAPEIEQQIKSGAGFGDPETNKKVERAAILLVTEWYENHGWRVLSVETKKCGYDLRCNKQGVVKHVEVKGIRGTGLSFIITAGEMRQARNNPQFVICMVTSALSENPQIFRYSGEEFIKKFNIVELAFRANLRP